MQVDARTIRRYAVAIVCALLLASPAAAQFNRGTISGVVKDQSGGVVPSERSPRRACRRRNSRRRSRTRAGITP